MVGHYEQGLLTQPQALALHGRGHHFKGFSGTNFVCQQCISTIKHMSNGVFLVLTEGNIRVHTTEYNMIAVVLTGSGRVEQLIVFAHKGFPSAGVFPNPVTESIFDGLLFLLCQSSLLLVQHTTLLSIRILDGVVDTNVLQVQGFLQNAVGIGTVGTVGHIGSNIVVAGRAFAGDAPLCGNIREFYLDIATEIVRSFKGFLHELLDIVGINPGGSQTHINFGSVQVFGLCLFQSLQVGAIFFTDLYCHLCLTELFTDIAGEIFVCGHIAGCTALRQRFGDTEDHATQIRCNFVSVLCTQKLCHERQVHLATLTDTNRQSFRRGIHAGYFAFRANSTLGEHICLALEIAVLVHIFQGTEEIVGGIIGERFLVGFVVD